MATPVFCCGFECGNLASSAHIATATGVSIDTTTVRSGLRSLKLTASAATVRVFSGFSFSANAVMVARFYIYFTTLPNADWVIFSSGLNGNHTGAAFKVADSKIYPFNAGTFGATGVAITTNTWYRIDVRTDATNNPWLFDVSVDGTACAQLSVANAAATSTQFGFGDAITAVTTTCYIDDLTVSQTGADYPLGDGYILSYIPNADGSHNVAGANDFERTLTGTDITNATTDAYELVNERPLPTTAVDFINGIAPFNETDYVEVAYEDSAELLPPRSVEAIVVHHDAGGAGTNSWTWTLRDSDGGTSGNVHSGTTNVGATITTKRAHFATIPGGGAWTLAAFNALQSRFLVADASPDVYIDAAMLEAEYAPVNIGGEHPITEWPMRRRLMVLAH